MNWRELADFADGIKDENEFSPVYVWDKSTGEFYPADVAQTTEPDGIIEQDRLFITITSSQGNDEEHG